MTAFFSHDILAKALDILKAEGVIAIPTETVYGLAANACSHKAVASIFALKQRPAFNPLIAHFYSQEHLSTYVHLTPLAEALLQAFAPGPLTLVLEKRQGAPVSDLVTAGLDTLAVRIPRHPIARTLIKSFGLPLAAPSANLSERLSPTQAWHVAEAFKDASFPPFTIDGGPCQQGLESTILDARGNIPLLLRPGSLSVEAIEETLGLCVQILHSLEKPQLSPINASTHRQDQGQKAPLLPLISPGQMKRHYAPQTPLKLNVTTPSLEGAHLAFGKTPFKGDALCQLSATGNLEEAAMNLFTMLRVLDGSGKPFISVAPIPEEGLGLAINDRLKRASYPRTE